MWRPLGPARPAQKPLLILTEDDTGVCCAVSTSTARVSPDCYGGGTTIWGHLGTSGWPQALLARLSCKAWHTSALWASVGLPPETWGGVSESPSFFPSQIQGPGPGPLSNVTVHLSGVPICEVIDPLTSPVEKPHIRPGLGAWPSPEMQ